VAAARLGARASLVARIGTDARGQAIFTRLTDEGVDTRYLTRDAETPTGVALIMVAEKGEKQILTAPGANTRLTETEVLNAATAIKSARVLLVPLEVPLGCVMAAARLAKSAEAKVGLDPAQPRQLPDALLHLTDVIKPNEHWLPLIPVQSVDATGAGDAFAAALAVALAEGRPWEEAGMLASACAALKTTVIGAQAGLPKREAVSALLTQRHSEIKLQ